MTCATSVDQSGYAQFLMLCGFGGCVALVAGGNEASKSTATFSQPAGDPAASNGSAESTRQGTPDEPKSDVAPAGATVRDGKFEFSVTAVDPPVVTLGDNPYLRETAQGEYIQVHVTVTNIGNRPQTYWADNQTLIDDQGREFSNDTSAGIDVNDGTAMMAEINLGNSIGVVIVFDVPPGTVLVALELHDSIFSGGAKVALR
ncbi:DUF4352 domain-containing protein [Nocardia rhizosphaerae]|uniref:DUF4352 domain-containing protein n=1 Tax=Nocardia rhizosphaerae TaxID=1691571 RepID=A0ABV8L8E1_9NOCA